MRAIGCFLLGVIAAVLVVAFGVFALENGQVTQFTFLGNTMRANLWLLVGIPAVVGFVLALLVVTPARAAGDRSGSTLRGQYRSLERDLANQQRQNEELRVENSRLQARYDQALAERNALNSRLVAAQQAPVQERVVGRDTRVDNETPTTVTQREEPVAPGTSGTYERVPEQQPVTADEAVQPTPAAQPTLGDRLRGVFSGQRTTDEEETDRLNSRGPAPTM